MASKRKKEKEKGNSRNNRQFRKILYLVVTVGLLWLAYVLMPGPSKTGTEIVRMSNPMSLADQKALADEQYRQAEKVVYDEISWITSEDSVPAGVPATVRDGIVSMVELNQQHKFNIEINTNQALGISSRFMSSHYVNGVPEVIIYTRAVNEGMRQVTREKFRAVFVAALYHELVHLEWSHYTLSPVDSLYEEIRAYSRTDWEAVRPMLKKGMVLPNDFVRLDVVLLGCGDDPFCPQYREAIRIQNHSQAPAGS